MGETPAKKGFPPFAFHLSSAHFISVWKQEWKQYHHLWKPSHEKFSTSVAVGITPRIVAPADVTSEPAPVQSASSNLASPDTAIDGDGNDEETDKTATDGGKE